MLYLLKTGKIQSQCDFANCFVAVVASGRTNFEGDGGDLANIYVPANDYDTWKQFVSSESAAVEGEFVYQMQNDTHSCLTIELRWGFAPTSYEEGASGDKSPVYQCAATPLAMNWDCHLDWALVTECTFNSTSNQISALYTVTNMGPERVAGEGQVIIINKHEGEKDRIRMVGSKRGAVATPSNY